MFADDMNLFMTEKILTKLVETQMYIKLKLLIEWFQVNLLSLNISKINYIIFGKKGNINANILCGGNTLVQLNETKFLRVILSSDLSWNEHVNNSC